jgi:flagellar assembly factor FliW
MIIQSACLGEIEVRDTDIIRFPEGLPGFPDEKSFAFLPYGADNPFVVLQSINEAYLSFVLADPFYFFKDYVFEINDTVAGELGLGEENPPSIFSIVTVAKNWPDSTANLAAPLIINNRDRVAAQLVLEKTNYTTKHRLFPEKQGGE